MDDQLTFDLFSDTRDFARTELSRRVMQQAVLGFLASQKPDALAGNVPACRKKLRLEGAAAWFSGQRTRREVVRTMAVVSVFHREHCFADCVNQRELADGVAALLAEKELMEQRIQVAEPQLKSSDDLFSEFSYWNYAASCDQKYHRLCRKLARLKEALLKGSRLERIRALNVADFLYVASPENLIGAGELPTGWGLLFVGADRRVRIVKEALAQEECRMEGRLRLALNIAAEAAGSVLFSGGVGISKKAGEVAFYRPPRRRGRV
ncbi:MAG: hypothetical protein PHS41_05685 [Victivallaceae bacterium]|nr:hypothetical protein [Victivallaceae bacterium]